MSSTLGRSLLELALAALAAVILDAVVPLGADDPFRSTLLVVPLIAAALRAIDRLAARRGARPLARPAGRAEAVALAVLALLTVGRHRLGLVAPDDFLAAGWALLLAARTGRQLLALRPCLGRSLPRRPAAAFFLLPLVVYLALQPWMSEHRQPDGDEPFYLLVAHSLVYDFDAELSGNYAERDWRRFMARPIEPQPGDPAGADGTVYSRHNMLLPLVLAPAYRLAGRAGAMMVMAAFAAALAWMVLRLGHHYARRLPGAVLAAYAVAAFAPPLLLYSYQVWVEVPAALLLALGLDRVALLGRPDRRRRDGALLVLTVVALPLLKIRFALVAAPVLALALWRARDAARTTLAAGAALGATSLAILAFNLARYANPLKIHQWRELDATRSGLDEYARGALGMFWDSAFGLFPNAPIWLLLLPALGLGWRRQRRLLTDLALVATPYLVIVAPRIEWYGGWSPPFRYPLVFLPLLALVLVPAFKARRRATLRTLLAASAALTLVLSVIWIVFPGWTYNFADGRTLLLDRAGATFGADVARLFPSFVRPRAASWIWPLLALGLIPLSRWRRRSSAGAAASAGVAILLLALAAAPAVLDRWPTRTIELEDGFVRHHRGRPAPPLWVTQRPAYRGAWAMPPGSRLTAPVVAGGERLELTIHARFEGSAGGDLELLAGERRLAMRRVAGGWQWIELGPFDWPPGAPLVLRRPASAEVDFVVVDRAELTWR